MQETIKAKRRMDAIKEIARKTGIDVSKGSVARGIPVRDVGTLQVLQLEKLANELAMDSGKIDVKMIAEEIRTIKGVGKTLADKIEEHLAEVL